MPTGSLHDYAVHAASVLGTEAEASITVRQHGTTLRAASSSDAAGRCDQAEARADDGPCVDAMKELRIRVVPELSAEERWPAWRGQAVREGFVTAIAVPARVSDGIAIALNLYARTMDPWDARVLTAADSYAQLIAAVVRMQLELSELEDKAAGVYRDMSDTVAIERAIGTIMQTNDCTAQEAERILRDASEHHDVSRRQIAETILRALVRGRS